MANEIGVRHIVRVSSWTFLALAANAVMSAEPPAS